MSTNEQQQGAIGVPQWTVGDRMRKALAASGLSVQAMAAHLELNRMTVGNYMSGKSTPTAATIRTWAMRCGVPYEWLRYGTEPAPETGPGQEVRPLSWMDDRRRAVPPASRLMRRAS